ncbi:MAG: peptidoglycan bridge formation glycyltransferase FemA/FemB family protein [Candidatus Curtissbacteria bacterium]|nr:peptidoglycan bridge formation glycyltransferase FemA/FemB family protein [Candidatus Curtissbacteria bacterium]
MSYRILTDKVRTAYDKQASHIIQSWEWGEFRKKTGVDVVRVGHFEGRTLKKAYQLTFHKVPKLNWTIGYFPKGPMPDKGMVDALEAIGREKNAAFIKIEPDVIQTPNSKLQTQNIEKLGLVKAKKALFTKYNFVLDLTRSEEQILAGMHPKTRYNIKVAQKKGVEVYDSVEDKDFEIYLKLYFETTKRQKYFGHTPTYHRLAWKTLKDSRMARVMIAKYNKKPLVAWMLFSFGDTLYYPYGGSSTKYKDVMASNLLAWEAIRLGKKLELKTFDMWGALGPEPDTNDPWYGFHRFKAGYGARHVEYVGTYDLVLDPTLYRLLSAADTLRWFLLRATRF